MSVTPIPGAKTLLIDIETSPNLAWTFETKRAFISWDAIVEPTRTICFAAKWLGEDSEVMFYSEWQHGKEGLIAAAYTLLGQADIVIHYNGERFDEKRLNQEFSQRGWPPPPPYQRIDLWKTVSGRFDLPSQKLAFVLEFFGLPNKVDTGGIRLWIALMNGEQWAYRKMETYNRNDVSIMEPLYYKLRPWILKHPNANLFSGAADFICPTCGSMNLQKRGNALTGLGVYQRWQCKDCGRWSQEAKRQFGADLRPVAA